MNSLFYKQTPVDIYQTQNGSTQMDGAPTELNSCRSCNKNLSSDNPASQYKRQKIIQNTVRVQSSLYTMNLAGLSAYQRPSNSSQVVEQAGTPYIVPAYTYWNQMSDRATPSVQRVKTVSGSTYRGSSTKSTIVRERPGAMSPGGIGVDIKHNSYDRYLNKLKGKAPLRRGYIPPNYGQPIPYNRAYPVKGGKTVKTGIIDSCSCSNIDDEVVLYKNVSNAIQDKIWSVSYQFNVGDCVWARKLGYTEWFKAKIMFMNGDLCTITFVDDTSKEVDIFTQYLIPYFECNCTYGKSLAEAILETKDKSEYTTIDYIALNSELDCKILEILEAGVVF